MKQAYVDRQYHALRELSMSGDDDYSEALYFLTKYLLFGGEYRDLLTFEAWYGEHYLLPAFTEIAYKMGGRINRIVDLGSGLGWLGEGLTKNLKLNEPCLLFDKRHWTPETRICDLEMEDLPFLFNAALDPRDLIVSSELFHCLNDDTRVSLLKLFRDRSFIIAEYGYHCSKWALSYDIQCSLKGCGQGTVGFVKSMLEKEVPDHKVSNCGPFALFHNVRR